MGNADPAGRSWRKVAGLMSLAAARAAWPAMSAARSRAFMALPPSTISAVRKMTAIANTTVNTATEPRSRPGPTRLSGLLGSVLLLVFPVFPVLLVSVVLLVLVVLLFLVVLLV